MTQQEYRHMASYVADISKTNLKHMSSGRLMEHFFSNSSPVWVMNKIECGTAGNRPLTLHTLKIRATT